METAAPKILLIDEEHQTLTLLRSSLESRGYRVFSAKTSQEALILAQSRAMDVAVIDVDLSDGQGFSTIARMLKDFPALKVIAGMKFFSQHGFQAKMLAQHLGAAAVLLKPYEPDTVLDVLQKILGSS